MSFMDQALREHQLPSSGDLEIQLPARREPKKEKAPEEPRELGQHGGAGGNAGGDAHAEGTVNAADGAPQPQRDDPDEGEHTDSTEEQIAARSAHHEEEAQPEAHGEVTTEAPAEPEETPEALEPEPEPAAEPARARTIDEILGETEGTSPRVFKRSGFSAGADTPTSTVTRFPQPALEKLRVMLAASAGGAFAEALSATSVLTAFIIANTGLDLDVDEDTAAAVEAFRENDPRLADVEDKVGLVLENIDQLARAVRIGLKRVGETGKIVDGLDFGVSFLVADRVARLTEPETDETTIEVVQKKSLLVRERIKAQSQKQRTIERQREERSNA